MRDLIVRASAELLRTGGWTAWSFDLVARRAGCAKGLVAYHYQTKTNLLVETARHLAEERHQKRLTALAEAGGARSLDRLWLEVLEDWRTGSFLASTALVFMSTHRKFVDVEEIRRAAARALELPRETLASGVAIEGMLDGLTYALTQGTDQTVARQAYDELWLMMVGG